MADIVFTLIRLLILFARNAVGTLNSPYVTFRKLVSENIDIRQTLFIPLLVILYFIFVALIRNGLHNPFLLTFQFNKLLATSVISFFVLVFLLHFLGVSLKGKGSIRQVYTLWSFSLIPTLVWFFTTSFLFLLFPPPRTLSIAGKLYSVFYIAFSIAVLSWKVILYYLTLRFALKLDLLRISVISAILTPVLVIYSLAMYRLGIFRIPFI